MTTVKGKTPKCKHCKEWVDKSQNDFFKNSTGYYHNSCYQLISVEKQHYKELVDYIAYVYKIKAPTDWMFKQIKEFKDAQGFTYKGMEFTLRYLVEVEYKELLDPSEAGIGIIGFYYYKARKYYSDMEEVKESGRNKNIDLTEEIVYVKRPTHNKRKQIRIEDI